MKTMSFDEWMDQADMPRQDQFGQWYDGETGIYFDPEAKAPFNKQLPQFWGKRVFFTELRNRQMEILVQNSRLSEVGRRVIPRQVFDNRPEGDEAQTEWACNLVGVSMR